MRGLNLSRLVKSSEGSFFKDQQTYQAANIRKALSKQEIEALKNQQPKPSPTVDTLSSISAQSAYRQLVKTSPYNVSKKPSSSTNLVHRSQNSDATSLLLPKSASSGALDPSIMRTLGSGKLNMMQNMKQTSPPHRPLPGSDKYADGAALGTASVSIATSIVASVGLAGVLVVYLKPGVIDLLRERTKQFSSAIDATLGERIRKRVKHIQDAGPVISQQKRERVGQLLSGAFGLKRSNTDMSDRDEEPDPV